jgi:hypothetical protein
MQMALMDYHVAEAHADGADGLPRGINQALRNYEEVYGSKM